MGLGAGESKRARRAAEQQARESEAARLELEEKEREEMLKAQRKLIRGAKGKLNPFQFLPDDVTGSDTLGGV